MRRARLSAAPLMFQHEATGTSRRPRHGRGDRGARRAVRRRRPARARAPRPGPDARARRPCHRGPALLDEAMVAAIQASSRRSHGIVYCGVIAGCQDVFDVRRARVDRGADGVVRAAAGALAFTGRCLVHRAEIVQVRGAWGTRSRGAARPASASRGREQPQRRRSTRYRQGEMRRLAGEFAGAEKAYREASRLGGEPQPGLALLRLAQGQRSRGGRDCAARSARRRSRTEAVRLLPAAVEACSRSASWPQPARLRRARGVATESGGDSRAMAAQARGAVALAWGTRRRRSPRCAAVGSVWQRPRRAVRRRARAGADGARLPRAR